ncbi:Retrovirus-related Pol polyprotein from transposon 17.6 [Vitis vinifera]|uniref:Retrovirus-related Pol polyprotein from transposon 17.6 n=1 Tax=Vitis vinifera TaxID=29760 RepID=A0A438C1S9_VITVI|nr:Retrovirus-related Pol polyprotein from transposon 17.6 [Vitis vinifera]
MAGCSAMEALQERIAQMKEMLREWLLEDGTVALWAEHTVGKSKNAKKLENFLWDMEQFFRAAHIPDAEKTPNEELKDQFLLTNTTWMARESLKRLRQTGLVRDYVKEFNSLMLDIKNMSEEDKIFKFMFGTQEWAQTELWRQGVHDLPVAMVAADCLVDYKMGSAISTTQKPKSEGGRKAKVEGKTSKKSGWKKQNKKGDSGATHNFVATREATRLGLELEEDISRIKAVNSKAQKIQGVAKNVPMQVGDLKGTCSLLCVPLDDFNLILGVDFLLKAKVALIPHLGGLVNKALDLSSLQDVSFRTIGATQIIEGIVGCRLDPTLKGSIWCTSAVPKEARWLSTLQQEMRKNHLCNSIWFIRVSVHLDDIVVDNQTLTEHERHLRLVFQRLREHGIYVKLEKCEFAQMEITFLGHNISVGLIRMDEGKVPAIKGWPVPSKLTVLPWLGQLLQKEGHPMAFESRNLNNVEQKYSTHEKEMIVMARWQEFLADFKFEWLHRPGKHNTVANALSRKEVIAYITTLSEVISNFNERIKQAVEQDVAYGRLRQQVKEGVIRRNWLEGDLLAAK